MTTTDRHHDDRPMLVTGWLWGKSQSVAKPHICTGLEENFITDSIMCIGCAWDTQVEKFIQWFWAARGVTAEGTDGGDIHGKRR